MNGFAGLGLLACVNIFLLRAPGLALFPQRLLRVCGLYILIAFTIRGGVLLLVQPKPTLDRSFAITYLYPDYVNSLGVALPLEALGLTVMSVVFYLLVVGRGSTFLPSNVDWPFLVLLFALGTLIAFFVAISGSSELGQFGGLGQVLAVGSLAMLVLCVDWRNVASLRRYIVPFIFVVEVVFSAVSTSKTPLLTALLLLYLDPRRRQLNIRAVVAAAASVVAAFTVIQGLKGPASEAARNDGFLLNLYFAMTGRLDGLVALGAATYRGPGTYNLDGGAPVVIFRNFLPNYALAGDKVLVAVTWGREMYQTTDGVSYAEGLMAEGYAIGGIQLLLLWALLGGTLLALAVRLASSRSVLLQWVALSFLASTAVFERGLVGQAEQLGASAQSAVLVAVIYILGGRRGRSPRNNDFGGIAPIRLPAQRRRPARTRVNRRSGQFPTT